MTRNAEHKALLDGTGFVFFNPDTGEEYAEDHPVKSGECIDAQHIRRSTNMEDALWGDLQARFQETLRLKKELGRAYRALHGFYNAFKGKVEASPSMEAYHLPTLGAAARFVHEQSFEGADYFVGKKIEVLHTVLNKGDSE